MSQIDVVKLVKDGQGRFEWGWVLSEHAGDKLAIAVFRDAMKFDGVPSMNWGRKILPGSQTYDGVRLPATANELQQIADHLGCMLLTPKIVDLLWEEAGSHGTQLDSVVNIRGKIVAVSNVQDVHEELEKAIVKAGGDLGGTAIIDSVGKYWVLSNRLVGGKYGTAQAVNYGWPTKGRGNGPGVTRTCNVWQTVGAAHNDQHLDPSQTIRLMYRWGRILRGDSQVWEDVDLHEVALDPLMAPFISHEGPLKTLRQLGVPEPQGTTENGVLILPEAVIYDLPKSRWEMDGLFA